MEGKILRGALGLRENTSRRANREEVLMSLEKLWLETSGWQRS